MHVSFERTCPSECTGPLERTCTSENVLQQLKKQPQICWLAPQVNTDGEIPAFPLRLYGDGAEVFSALVLVRVNSCCPIPLVCDQNGCQCPLTVIKTENSENNANVLPVFPMHGHIWILWGTQNFEMFSLVSILGVGRSSQETRFPCLGCKRVSAQTNQRPSQLVQVAACSSLGFASGTRSLLDLIVWTQFWCGYHGVSMPWATWLQEYEIKKSHANNGSVRNRLGTGTWPSADPWGQSFSSTYQASWHAKAGQRLAGPWKAVLDGIQADQDLIHKVFKLKRPLLSNWDIFFEV